MGRCNATDRPLKKLTGNGSRPSWITKPSTRWVRTWVVSGSKGLLGEEGGWLGHLTAAGRIWGSWGGDGGGWLLLPAVIWDGPSAAGGRISAWLDKLKDKSTTVEQGEAQKMSRMRSGSWFQAEFFWGRCHLLHCALVIQEKVEKFEKKDEEIHLSSQKGSCCSLWVLGQTEIMWIQIQTFSKDLKTFRRLHAEHNNWPAVLHCGRLVALSGRQPPSEEVVGSGRASGQAFLWQAAPAPFAPPAPGHPETASGGWLEDSEEILAKLKEEEEDEDGSAPAGMRTNAGEQPTVEVAGGELWQQGLTSEQMQLWEKNRLESSWGFGTECRDCSEF